jgi:23S rRNA pseudouridine2605 synthase
MPRSDRKSPSGSRRPGAQGRPEKKRAAGPSAKPFRPAPDNARPARFTKSADETSRFSGNKRAGKRTSTGGPRGEEGSRSQPARTGNKHGARPQRQRPDGNPLAHFTKGRTAPAPATGQRPEKKSFVKSRLHKQRTTRADSPRVPKKDDGLIRLNKFISNSGVCSRREADNLISMGLVSVNGTTITELGYKVKPTDEVRYEGKRLKAEKPVYILLNKPKGFLTTTDDPQERHTVMQLISGACRERVYPVGRLDRNTTGLLLLTNDGDLADKLTHPSYNVKKIYKAELDKPITKADFEKVVEGVQLEEGRAVPDDVAIVSDDKKTIGIELHVGWNRIVRRIFETLGYEVVKLDRVVYAGLDKKDLPRGNWRMLKEAEVIRLKHLQ